MHRLRDGRDALTRPPRAPIHLTDAHAMPRTYTVTPPTTALVWLLPAFALLLALIGLAVMIPQTPSAAWGMLPVALAGVLLAAGIRRRHVELDAGELRIAAGILRRRVQRSTLRLDAAAVVDLSERTELRPAWRSFGIGLPGYRAGHYRLRNGTRAFVLVTDTRRVLVLPEQDGRTLLLSLEQPQALLDALRSGR